MGIIIKIQFLLRMQKTGIKPVQKKEEKGLKKGGITFPISTNII
jgi:hypothetical protein